MSSVPNFPNFEVFWAEVERLKVFSKAAINQIPESLSNDTKKKLTFLRTDKAIDMILTAIGEIDHGSIETLDNLLRKYL